MAATGDSAFYLVKSDSVLDSSSSNNCATKQRDRRV